MNIISISHRQRWFFIALLLSYLATGIFYAFDNPLYLKPDETYHFAYVQHLLQGKGLPTVDTSQVGVTHHSAVEAEGHQPPLYYSAVATIAVLFQMQDHLALARNPHFLSTQQGNRHVWTPLYANLSQVPIFLSGRLLSLLCALIALSFTYRLARIYLPPEIAWLSVALVGLNPQFLFIATSFSNDMASVMMIQIGLWMLAVVMQQGLSTRWAIALGGVIALATLTKIGGLGLFVPLGVIALWQTWQRKQLRPMLNAALVVGVWLLLCSWWLWRNWLLYHDPFTTTLLPVLLGVRSDPFTGEVLRSYLTFVWKSYWLDFSPGGILFADDMVYRVIGVVCLATLGGSVVAFVRKPPLRPMFGLLWGSLVLIFVLLLRMTSGTAVFMGGGRLLFPAAASVGVTMAVGFAELHLRRWAVPGLVAVCWTCVILAPFRYLHTNYPRPKLVDRLLHDPTFPLHAQFADDSFELIGYDLKRVDLRPEEVKNGVRKAIEITYYWRALKGSQQNYSLFVQWIDPQQMQPVSQIDTYPAYGSFPTSQWQPGKIFTDSVRLNSPPNSTSSNGVLLTGLYDFATMQRLPIQHSHRGKTASDAICLAQIGKFSTPSQFAGLACPDFPNHEQHSSKVELSRRRGQTRYKRGCQSTKYMRCTPHLHAALLPS